MSFRRLTSSIMKIVLTAHKPLDVSEINQKLSNIEENDIRRELWRLAGNGSVEFTADLKIVKGNGIPIK
jgi:predicted ArsR family transcriptional regulator